MTVRRWLFVMLGLMCWAGIAVAWATSPAPCAAPDEHGAVECAR